MIKRTFQNIYYERGTGSDMIEIHALETKG